MDTNLDNISFPAALYHRLYRSGIIHLNYATSRREPEIVFSGENRNHVLIAIDISGEMNDNDKDLLKNLMSACEIEMDDVALVNIREQAATFKDILEKLKIEKAILFGIPSGYAEAVIEGPDDKPLTTGNRIFIKTGAISDLHNQTGKKKVLWSALKLMFNL